MYELRIARKIEASIIVREKTESKVLSLFGCLVDGENDREEANDFHSKFSIVTINMLVSQPRLISHI